MRWGSSGRKHATVLDANNHIWLFLTWGRPFRLLSPLVDSVTDNTTPIQVESGWIFSAVLTKSGDVLVWWPEHGMREQVRSKNAEFDLEGDKRALPTQDRVIPCITWGLHYNPVTLRPLPPLPKLTHTKLADKEDEETRLIRIAGLNSHLVGLTNHGHVLKVLVDDETTAPQSNWEYVKPVFFLAFFRSYSESFSPVANVQRS
jgi:SCF-associated factor 1